MTEHPNVSDFPSCPYCGHRHAYCDPTDPCENYGPPVVSDVRSDAERIHWSRDDLPTGPIVFWRGTPPKATREVRYVPEAEVERLREGWDADVDWANKLLVERDEARAEVERLREERDEARAHASENAWNGAQWYAKVERLREESSQRREALAELTCYIEVGDLHPDVQDRIDAALREPSDITALPPDP